MKLNPQQAPLYGDSVITVVLTEDDELQDDVVFYLLFAGSTLKHLTSTNKVDSGTLKTITPGHDCCETVKVSLCASKKGLPVLVVAEESFQFVQDEVYDSAQFLADSAGNQQALIFARLLDRSRPPSGDATFPDEKVTLAFRHLSLPEGWNVLGTSKTINENIPQETLMHFAVRHGLLRLAWFLLHQPGGRVSLDIQNNEGATPVSLALERGFQKLHQLLTDEKASEPDSWSSVSHVIHSGDLCVKHHRGLNVYTLTERLGEGAESSLENNIGELRKHMENHSQQTITTTQSQPELGTTMDFINLSEKVEQNQCTEATESAVSSSKESEAVSSIIHSMEKLSALNFPVENSDVKLGDTVESNTSDSQLRVLGGVIAESSGESINKDLETRKEEEGETPIVASENVSDKHDCTPSTPIGMSGVEIPPSCGNTNAETGITLTGMVLLQENLCDTDNANQEVKSTREGTSVSVAVKETENQTDNVTEFAVDMGQAVSTNCTKSGDGVQAQDFLENEKHDICTTGADLLEFHLCQEDMTMMSATELTTRDAIGSTSGEVSRNVDECQKQDPSNKDVTSEAIYEDDKNVNVHFKEKEMQLEHLDNCLEKEVASVELVLQKIPCEKSHDGNQLLLTTEVQSAVEESLERGDSLIVEVTKSWSGEHAIEQKDKDTAVGLTGLCERDGTNTAETPNPEIKTELDALDVNVDTKPDLPHEDKNTVTILNAVHTSRDTVAISTENEIAGRSCTEISNADPEDQETDYCNTENQAAKGEMSSVVNEDHASVFNSESVDQDSTVEPLSTKAEQELLHNQTRIFACDSGAEQQLHCLSGDIGAEVSAIELVQKEAVQEVQQGFVSLLAEDEELINNESRVPVPPTGDINNEASSCRQGQHVQGCLTDTPSSMNNKVSEENQEVPMHPAVLTEQNIAIIETALCATCRCETEPLEDIPFQPAAGEEAKPSQLLCESGAPANEKDSSQSTVLESSVSLPGKEPDVESNDLPDTGLTKGVAHQEADSGMAVDAAEGAVHDLIVSTLHELQTTGDDTTLTTGLKQECDLDQSLEVIPLHDSIPESTTDPLSCEEASVAAAKITLTGNTEEEVQEEEEESENVTISRASLLPIAEEPLSDSDSSEDSTSSSSDSEIYHEVNEFAKDEPQSEENSKYRNSGTLDLLLPLGTADPDHCVAHHENASVKSFVQGLVGSVEVEDSIYTDGTLTDQELEPSLDLSDPCTAASTEDLSALEEVKNRISEEIPIEMATTPKGEEDSGLELSELNDEDLTSPGGVESEPVSESLDMKCEDEIDFAKRLQTSPDIEELINRESWCSIEPCPGPQLLEPKHTNDSTECESFLEDGLGSERTSSHRVFQRESGSDSDIFHLSGEGMDDLVFTKPEEEQSACDITSSSSSADDTTSLERTSSRGSDISLPRTFNTKKHKSRHSLDSSCSSTTAAAADGRENGDTDPVEMEGEEMDSITEVPVQASLSRSSMRSLSPFRRHSWGPGKNTGADTEINQRSSMRILGDVVRKSPSHRRSMSWCPSDAQCISMGGDFNYRSYSLEGLAADADDKSLAQTSEGVSLSSKELAQPPLSAGDERSSLVYLNEEDLETKQRETRLSERQERSRLQTRGFSYSTSALSPPLTKSMSLVTIHQPGLEAQGRTRPKRRISFSFNIPPLAPKSKHVYSIGSSSSDEESDSTRSFNSTSSSLAQSISEESCNQLPPSPSRKDLDVKGGTKVSRTFSYIKNKMSSKKTKEKEKDKDKTKEKEKDSKEKEKDKKTLNGHQFSTTPIVGPAHCLNCIKPVTCKDAYLCSNCNSIVHKGCRESYASCAKVKMKQQKVLQSHDTSSLPTVIMRNKNSQTRERPRSAIVVADENTFPMLASNKRPQTSLSLSKSVSIQNIAGAGSDDNQLGTWKYLSHSTDSLNKLSSKVTESMESLNDEGTDMNEGQLMGDFEMDSKQLEAESWSQVVDSKFLKQQKKEVVKRQDVIYELMQTEMHHVRTLKIMSDVYSRGMMTELQFDQQMVEKIFPCLDDLLRIHFQFFQHILDRRKDSMAETSDKNFVIKRIGDLLVNQFSGENAERMKKIYGKFCGHHNEAVNYFKDLLSKEKRFQAFVKKKMSSTVVRRLGIPECILLVTQRITKYPVLLQRILQYTKENEVEHEDLAQSLVMVKDVITAVNSKVNNYEKKMRLNEIYSKTDSKSIQRMKSGKMFAKEDLKRRKLIRDGPVLLKTAAGRLKDVQAVLLSDTLVFLQEKDQKYVFASLEQKSTVISLKRLIVRDVAHEEKGLFLISMGEKDPEMVEVHASTKEERNSWIQSIQDTMNTMGKDEDEGVPSESEEERKILDTKAKELNEQLQQKDKQILALLNEKENIFRNLCSGQEDSPQDLISRALFRASTEEAPKGEQIVKTAIKEVETLQSVVSRNLGGTLGHQASSPTELEGVLGPISLPRRAETFGGFDSHQMTALKNGEKDEVDDNQDLRRTESDGVLKKGGGNANLMFLLKRNNEQVLYSVSHLHELLSTLQAVVLQQDTYIEDRKLVLNERAVSRTLSKPNSLIEQEKQRSLEKQRQELANLQKQQAHHLEEKRKREKEWDAREKELAERESRLAQREEQTEKGLQELEKDKVELQARKEEYQRDLERLRAAQKQLEKETEQLKRDMDQVTRRNLETDCKQDSHQHDKVARTSSMAGDPLKQSSSSSPKQDHLEPISPKKEGLLRTDSKQKGKGPFHLLTSTNQTNKPADKLFNLSKPKEKKEKKKKSKGGKSQPADSPSSDPAPEGEEIFC